MTSNFSSIQSIFNRFKELFILAGIVLYILFKGAYIPHFCLIETFIGLKCSFCDITHSYDLIFEGQFLNALKVNFLSFGLIFYLSVNLILRQFNKMKNVLLMNKLFFIYCIVQFINVNL